MSAQCLPQRAPCGVPCRAPQKLQHAAALVASAAPHGCTRAQVIRDVPASRDANATCSPTLDDRQKHNYVVACIHVTNAQEIATKMLTR